VPADLPSTYGFVDRDEDLAWVRAELATEHAVAVVGRRGVGTSACAVQAANTVRDRFPDGQVYLDLRGYGHELRPRQVLGALTRKLGAGPPRSARAADLAAAGAALRATIGDRRVLLVLDNVSDPAQVRHLLPPAPESRLLMAGTPALADLGGVALRWLGEPDAEAAAMVLADARARSGTTTGNRSRVDDPATDAVITELVDLCGRQPRALRAIGHQIGRAGWRADELLAVLRHAMAAPPHQPIGYTEALRLLSVQDVAYHALPAPARRLLRLLSLAPDPLDREAVGALTPHAGRTLDALVDAGFVMAAEGGRYEIRPLLTAYARVHLHHDEPVRRRVRAQASLIRHLARQAEQHAAALATGSDRAGAQTWFELHHAVIQALVVNAPGGPAAVVHPLPRTVRRWWFRLAVALCTWYAEDNRLDPWEAVCEAVLATRIGADRPTVTGWAHNELGVIRRRRGDPHDAAAALTLAVTGRGQRGQAQARTNLGLALLDQGEVDAAVDQLQRARRHRALADRAGQALTDLALGAAHLTRGDPETARHHLVTAANTFDALGERRGYAAALSNLIVAQWRLGEYLDSAHASAAALEAYDEVDDPIGRSTALLNTGGVLLSLDPPRAEAARDMLTQALALRSAGPIGPGVGRILLYLGDAEAALGRPEVARERWTVAARACADAGDLAGGAAVAERLAR
jgi:tetratricopeptide (TPR) repeat protein